MLTYPASKEWPGNVCELINFIRRLVLFFQGQQISMPVGSQIEGAGDIGQDPQADFSFYKDAQNAVLDQFTRTYVTDILHTTQGNISEAARKSGLERVSLQKIIRRMGTKAQEFRK
ncbi:MAG: helix-turn-helix domain-containing protein [Thermodesulfobacteriota bacterium]